MAALKHTHIIGSVTTNVAFLLFLLNDQHFASGSHLTSDIASRVSPQFQMQYKDMLASRQQHYAIFAAMASRKIHSSRSMGAKWKSFRNVPEMSSSSDVWRNRVVFSSQLDEDDNLIKLEYKPSENKNRDEDEMMVRMDGRVFPCVCVDAEEG